MIRGTCVTPNCTVATTGTCLESHKPASCPYFTPGLAKSATKTYPPLGSDAARRFLAGTELGLQDALKVTQGGYAHLVAILGPTDAGKTCLLCALYLLASHAGLLPRFRFSGSLTLPGFEQRTRKLRTWQQGRLPDQFTDHTELADPRNPGLLHLALSDEQGGGRRIELLLTDLPGEWTSGLIQQAQSSHRFDFLRRADGVVIAVDGPKLVDLSQKHAELTSLKQLIDRFAETIDLDRKTPIVLAVCKADVLRLKSPTGLDAVVDYATEKGFSSQIILVSSFSRDQRTAVNGHGVCRVIEAIIDHRIQPPLRPSLEPQPTRSFGRSPALS